MIGCSRLAPAAEEARRQTPPSYAEGRFFIGRLSLRCFRRLDFSLQRLSSVRRFFFSADSRPLRCRAAASPPLQAPLSENRRLFSRIRHYAGSCSQPSLRQGQLWLYFRQAIVGCRWLKVSFDFRYTPFFADIFLFSRIAIFIVFTFAARFSLPFRAALRFLQPPFSASHFRFTSTG